MKNYNQEKCHYLDIINALRENKRGTLPALSLK